LLFALLLGLSVFAVSYNLLSAYIRTEKVVVAARYLEPYRQISVSDIKVVELPRKGIHPDSIRKPEELIGNYTVCPLFAGQLVLAGHVMSSHNRPGISLELPAEGRAIFVPADASRAVGGLVNPGDRVDLIWSPKGASVYQPGGYHGAVTVVDKARVVEVIHDKSGEFRGIVIAAPPETCEHIAHCLETGSIYLVLVPWNTAEDGVPLSSEVWPGK
jgi:pilus assembly protein CpaB